MEANRRARAAQRLPSPWLRGALTFTGTIGLALAVGGSVLRRRRAM